MDAREETASLEMVRSPIRVGPLTLKNRLVFPPFETNYATPDSFPTKKHVALYGEVAAGGIGLIVIEAVNINPDVVPTKFGLSIGSDKYVGPLKEIVRAVHQENAHVIVQLVDKSELDKGRYGTEMAGDEIAYIVKCFVEGILRSAQAGFDGIELHAAHLYTLADFLSRDRNKRSDAYNTTLAGRIKIIEEIYLGVRDRIPKDFVLAVRFNGDDFLVGGNTLADAMAIGRAMEKMGFDLLDVSAGGRIESFLKTGQYGGWGDSYSAARCVPSNRYPDAANIHLAEGVKNAVDRVPVIGCGKIGSLELAERLLREGRADLIGLARAVFCDPALPRKTLEGREAEVVKCNWCNQCHRLYIGDKEVVCNKWSL